MSNHLIGKSCSLGLQYVLIANGLFVISAVTYFGIDGRIVALIVAVPRPFRTFYFEAIEINLKNHTIGIFSKTK